MVQCVGAGEEEGWVAPVLHWLPLPKRLDQKGHLPLATHARDHGEHGLCPTLFMHGLEEWVLASQNGRGLPTIYCLHGGKYGRVWIPMHALWAVQCPSNIPMPHAKLSGGAKSHICPNLLGQCDSLLQDRRGTPGASSCCTGAIHGTQFETEAIQM